MISKTCSGVLISKINARECLLNKFRKEYFYVGFWRSRACVDDYGKAVNGTEIEVGYIGNY